MRRCRTHVPGNLAFLLGLSLPLLLANLPTQALAAWAPKKAPLMTAWSEKVSPSQVLPEYPRPQMTRERWQNLNGEWQFANAHNGEQPPFGKNLSESILVPFPIESALSGIMRRQDRMWYRRTFSTASDWKGQRVLLHFGAVDWEANVYINGQHVGGHRGGMDGFSFDITDHLKDGANEIIVGVYDPTDASENVVGKQVASPNGIWYTSASGIWQTVWLEPVPKANITRLDITPHVAQQELGLVVQAAGLSGESIEAVAYSGGEVIGSATGRPGSEIRIPVTNPRLWSPEDPFLYDLKVTLKRDDGVVDEVKSYFGMRSIGLATIDGILRPVLNGKFVFQMGTLDQGYWPDGIYTAPTDAALRFDLERHKELGYNMVRKHIKVEPARWFYWADRLGLLVWQDMPSMRAGLNPSGIARQQFERELREMIDEHRSSPSIVMWVLQNEGWGQHDQARVADIAKSMDPTRLVNNMSGINCCGAVDGGNGDVVDWHTYVGPSSPATSPKRIAVLGEFGGLGLKVDQHMWNPNLAFSYHNLNDSAALTRSYIGLIRGVQSLMKESGLSAAVYTEIVDVENEVNGMLTYDRKIMKVDAQAVRNAHQTLLDASRQSSGTLALNRFQSFQVVTPGFQDRYLRHSFDQALTDPMPGGSNGILKMDATFKVVEGLADRSCYSFESRNYPGHYLRHSAFRIRKDPSDGSALFNEDATFCVHPALDGSGNISLESKNYPGHYIRHSNAEVWLGAFEDTQAYRQDASWHVAQPRWKSLAQLPVHSFQSLRVTTPLYTDRHVRHMDNLGFTEVVNGASPPLLKADATFRIVPGLADNSCYSFESKNYPGHFLRHSSFRIKKEPNNGTRLFHEDATFCAQQGLTGKGVSLQSYNVAHRYLRHTMGALWISAWGDEVNPGESKAAFAADATWEIVPAWAP